MANRVPFLPRLWANWITLSGSVLTTISGVAITLLIALELTSNEHNPYSGTLMIVALPMLFVLGLLIIPVGLWVDRRKRRASKPDAPEDPVIDAFKTALRNKSARGRILFVAVATLVNVLLFGTAGQQAVHYMDSPKFCGTTCHTVMQPEWNAYNASPHSRVACVQCHIGPGASWAVKAKINGLHQVWGVLTGNHHRPIPSPVEHLRPSRDTCEQCHWPEKFSGNRLKIFPHFQQDETNTPAYNAMMLRIGGRDPKSKKYLGIHWHVSTDTQVKYEVLDEKRQKVGKITVLEGDKVVAEYLPGDKNRKLPALGTRTVDCVDCHNRPTHVFDRSPKLAVDKALAAEDLDRKVPWLSKVAADVLADAKDVPREGAEAYFRKALEAAYAKSHPEVKPSAEVFDQAAKTLDRVYGHNIYPDMKIGWGLYRSNLGHQTDNPDENVGCFRCHDGEHEAKMPDGSTKSLAQDCEQCHESLAVDEDPDKFDDSLKALLKKEP